MPSPIGHALGGLIAGLTLADAGPDPGPYSSRTFLIACALAAVAPDLDFLWGRHNMETHSLGAAVMAGLAVLGITRGRGGRLALAVTLAWSSHVLFDWLGSDTTPPLGVMALWPLNSEYYFANAFVFEAISRRTWLPNFWAHNLTAVLLEILYVGPWLALMALLRLRRR
jgi:membrane-bound metal-dependent hydrolase YbcI (DUF457 family)